MSDSHKVLSTVAAAKILGVATGTIQKMVDQGVLAGWKTSGGHRRVYQASIDQFLENQGATKNVVVDQSHSQTDRDKRYILVVEDSNFYAKKLELIIKQYLPDSDVIHAMNGFEAVECIATNLPDMILLDLQLPGIDGFAVLQHIDARWKDLMKRTLIISSVPQQEAEERLALVSEVTYFEKNKSDSQLQAMLNSMIAL